MSTEPYVPSDPPTREDWDQLSHRAERAERRGRRGLRLGVVSLVLAISVLIAGGVIYVAQRDVPGQVDTQTQTLQKVGSIVRGLQDSNRQQAAESKNSALAFAVILESVAAGFATPPAPDPARIHAVEGLCDTARAFRATAGDTHPPPCPAA